MTDLKMQYRTEVIDVATYLSQFEDEAERAENLAEIVRRSLWTATDSPFEILTTLRLTGHPTEAFVTGDDAMHDLIAIGELPTTIQMLGAMAEAAFTLDVADAIETLVARGADESMKES